MILPPQPARVQAGERTEGRKNVYNKVQFEPNSSMIQTFKFINKNDGSLLYTYADARLCGV